MENETIVVKIDKKYRGKEWNDNVGGMWKVLKTVFKRDSRHGARFIVVLIGLVIIFKAQLTELVQTIFSKITSESGKI